MQPGKYVYRSDFARRYYEEGLAFGRVEAQTEHRVVGALRGARDIVLTLLERFGEVRPELRIRVAACGELEELKALAIDLAAAPDREAIERRLDALPAVSG